MFKRIAQKLRPNKPDAQSINKISIEYGSLLAQSDCDAILFFMRPNLQWGGDLNKAVLEKAGKELDTHLLEQAIKPRSGDVFMLPPFNTDYKALFVAILADWDGGNGFEERDLLNCYRIAIEKAQEQGVKSIAIPAMGRDKRDFPHIRFARLAVQGILEKIDTRMETVRIMCADRTMMATYQGQMDKIRRRTS